MDALEKLGYKKRNRESAWEYNKNSEYMIIWKYDNSEQWDKGNYIQSLEFTSSEILAIAEIIKEEKYETK